MSLVTNTSAAELHYIRVIQSGLSTRLPNHNYTRCTELETETVRIPITHFFEVWKLVLVGGSDGDELCAWFQVLGNTS